MLYFFETEDYLEWDTAPGQHLSDTLDTSNVLTTVREAITKYGILSIVNSDQGFQFTGKEYKELLRLLHIQQSIEANTWWANLDWI